VLWQVPGWVLGGLVLAFTVGVLDLPSWVVPAGIAVLAVRDLALYPAMRAVFRPPRAPHPIGASGVALDALDPSGYVRIDGELWRAESPRSPVPAGGRVVVHDAHGLTLIVAPLPDDVSPA
jgi:membrane protein implicated in regulation of membrane protease activity